LWIIFNERRKKSAKLLPPIPQEEWHWEAVTRVSAHDKSAIIRAYNKIEVGSRREQVFSVKKLFMVEALCIPTMAELSQFFGFTGSWAESMLRSYSRFQNSQKEAKRGRPPVTNLEDDKCLLEFITKCDGQKNPPTIAQTLAFLQARGRNIDRHWVAHFIERHSTEIKQATATYMEAPRQDVSQLLLEDYFKAVDLALRDVNPRFVFNVDETRVHVKNPFPQLEVLIPALASAEDLTIAAVEDGTNLSMVGCISASGSRLPPYFISTRMTYDSTLESHDYYLDEDFFMFLQLSLGATIKTHSGFS
jgi:hypothetical protein